MKSPSKVFIFSLMVSPMLAFAQSGNLNTSAESETMFNEDTQIQVESNTNADTNLEVEARQMMEATTNSMKNLGAEIEADYDASINTIEAGVDTMVNETNEIMVHAEADL